MRVATNYSKKISNISIFDSIILKQKRKIATKVIYVFLIIL